MMPPVGPAALSHKSPSLAVRDDRGAMSRSVQMSAPLFAPLDPVLHHTPQVNAPGSTRLDRLVGDAVEVDAFHRAHARVELAMRDVMEGAGANHMPSGRFAANGA